MIGLCICCTFQEMPRISVDTNGKISSLFFLCLSVWQIVHFQQVFSIYLVGCRGVFFLGTASPLLSLHWMFLEVSTVSALLLIWDLNIFPEKRCPWWFIFCQLWYDISLSRVWVSLYRHHQLSWGIVSKASILDKNQLAVCQTQHIFFMGSTHRNMFWLIR